MSPQSLKKQIAEILKVYLAQTEREREIVEKLKSIAKWPEPSERMGEGGPGPLFTMGLFTQYKHDKENHENQIADILAQLSLNKKQ